MASEASFEPIAGKVRFRPSRVAWAVLALCFVLALLGRGLAESFTVFLLPISSTFGWDRADVVSIYSFAALAMGLVAPFVGRLFDLCGPRVVYALGLALLGSGLSLAAFAGQLWQLQICVGLAAGLGTACLGNVTGSLLLSRWFGARLPTAMAIVYSATGVGVLTLLPLSQLLIDHFSWRGAYHLLGGTLLALILPLVVLPWRKLSSGTESPVRSHAPDLAEQGWTLVSAMRHHVFWALFATFFFTAIGMYAIAVQVVAYLVDAGFPPLQAATAWGMSGVLLVVGMLTVSWLDSVIGRLRAILLSYSCTIIGLGLLWLLHRHPSIWVLLGFLLFFGSTIGSRGPLITATAMSIYRGERVGTIFGTISIGSGLGSALGSVTGGFIHDWTHSYDLVIAFAVVNTLLGMMPFLTVRELQ